MLAGLLILAGTLALMVRGAAQSPAAAAAPESCVGQYRESAEPDTVFSISRDGDAFYIEAPRMTRTLLTVKPHDELVAKSTGTHYMLRRDAAGKVTGWHRVHGADTGDAVKIGSTPVPNHFRSYLRSEAMIPVRDGVRLHAVILRPADQKGSLPVILERTPYGADEVTSDWLNQQMPELAQSGYIFVYEDIRGRYGSEGKFVMMRPVVHVYGDRTDPAKVDESSDAYDTVDWLVKKLPDNNGRVGVHGVSYPGFLATMAGIDPHPAVKAVSPQAPMSDVWLGDDFFHNGAFRETYGYDYVLGMESTKKNGFGKLDVDAYDYFLKAGNFAAAAKKGRIEKLPTAKAFVEHPAYDDFWKSMSVLPRMTAVTVPTLLVGGWWDQEDMWGPQVQYAALAPHAEPNGPELSMMLGPWRHGQWTLATTQHLGALNFGQAATEEFRRREAEFFGQYLLPCTAGCGEYPAAGVEAFQTGSDQWKHYAAWPLKGTKTRELYLHAEAHSLSFEKPKEASASASYLSDPANPVPYRHRPIQATYAAGSQWYPWLVEDQRFVSGRSDVVIWQTPVLDHDLTVTGDVKADIFAATTGSDADWVVKFIDVYPDDAPEGMGGYQLMIADEIFRGRYRAGFEHPQAIPPGEVEEYKWSLHGVDHVFLKGHRAMVEIQSSWFPLYDRNPQTFVPNIMTAPAKAYQPATETIYESAQYPSHLELPIEGR
ncbi:MAG TPA: CocE/NonD family hydrolase [Acidobacteriaceae bacterium]